MALRPADAARASLGASGASAPSDATTRLLLIDCPDEVGLVHRITGVLFRAGFSVVSNHEYVDPTRRHFFMRTEFVGDRPTEDQRNHGRAESAPQPRLEDRRLAVEREGEAEARRKASATRHRPIDVERGGDGENERTDRPQQLHGGFLVTSRADSSRHSRAELEAPTQRRPRR